MRFTSHTDVQEVDQLDSVPLNSVYSQSAEAKKNEPESSSFNEELLFGSDQTDPTAASTLGPPVFAVQQQRSEHERDGAG